MGASKIYSERLGAISDDQLEAAAARLGLGRFVRAAPVSGGLFGQNVFLTTSDGEFVLRGAPHWVRGPADKAYRREDRWQFAKEAFFVRQLHEHTRVPVPWPYLRDEASDIFGWPYAVMPRMPGSCFDDRAIRAALTPEARRAVAAALGAMLAEMQRLTSPFAGDFDVDAIALTAHPGGTTRQVIEEARRCAASAQENGAIAPSDLRWIEDAERRALTAAERPATYLHCDYKLNNLTVSPCEDGTWRVTGLFDFHEARFGDGSLDLVRQSCSYLDAEPDLARVFVEAHRAVVGADPELRLVTPLHVINDRLKIWEHFTRPGPRAPWAAGKTFREWAEPYVAGLLALL
ncbi:MAG: phosphotransferase family protein [Myxococcota bacterium]